MSRYKKYGSCLGPLSRGLWLVVRVKKETVFALSATDSLRNDPLPDDMIRSDPGYPERNGAGQSEHQN